MNTPSFPRSSPRSLGRSPLARREVRRRGQQVEPFRSWRLDDEKLAFPLIERAKEHGIKTIAIHKAAPLGPVPMNPYRIDDIDGAAGRFPEMNFEIIHAGMAFTEETAVPRRPS